MVSQIIFYALLSVLIISIVSFVGVFTTLKNQKRLRKVLIYVISFSAGALLGDAFLHLLPGIGLEGRTPFYVLGGIVFFFVLEKVIHWQHCHSHITEEHHVHSFGYTNLIGDALHNFVDGSIIVASYLVSLPAGIATTVAVALHEIPQEIGDVAVLIHAGFTKSRALMLNFITALSAILGAVVTLVLTHQVDNLQNLLIPISAGGFIYIAGSDLIPELHKHSDKLSRSFIQLLTFLLGIAIMGLLLVFD